MTSFNSSTFTVSDLQSIQEAIILLEPEQFEQAAQLSHQAATETLQWQMYIQGLAMYGFEEWLRDRLKREPINTDHCSLRQPQYAATLGAVCGFQVGEFTLCLITTESVAHEIVTLPRVVLDVPEFAAHFYIVLEVQEELAQLIVRGCLRYDQWLTYQTVLNCSATPDWTYQVPLDAFDADSNHLLFYLRFLEPESLSLPIPADSARSRLISVKSALERSLAELQPNLPLWQQLTWEEGVALLTCPPLLNLWQRSRNAALPTSSRELIALLNWMVEPAINLWQWSQNWLDERMQSLGWSVPRPLIPAGAMRQSTEKMAAAIADLSRAIAIPAHAHYATQTLAPPLQIGAVTWELPEDAWALLLILVAQPGSILPPGIQLQASVTTVLTQVTLAQDDLYLYVLLEGVQTEEFMVTILPPNELPLTLPVFAYRPSITANL
jgi:Protein of unknown function (DUF1822)